MGSVRQINSYAASRGFFNFSNVQLLIHGDVRPFIDTSSFKNPVANQGAKCTLSAGKIAFSEAAAGLYVIGQDARWKFGTGSWFISCKVTSANGHAGTSAFIMDTRPIVGVNGWNMGVNGTGSRAPFIIIEGTTYGLGTPAPNLLAGGAGIESTISFGYDGTTLRCFVDGALSWSFVVALNIDTGTFLCLGNHISSGSVPPSPDIDANTSNTMREFIIVKGETITSSFTVPSRWQDTGAVIESWVPSNYANVKLNVHMSGANGGVLFPDTSQSAKVATVNGNAQTSTAQFRVGNSSGLFDGTGDFVTYPDSADWDFGLGDYSIEIQVRTTNIAKAAQVPVCNFEALAGCTIQLSSPTSGRFKVFNNGNPTLFDSGGILGTTYVPFQNNVWTHIAHTRVNGVAMCMIEGELVFAAADSTNITGTVVGMYIGRLALSSTVQDFIGNLQELRIIKGEGYPRSFIVQTAPHPDS